MGHTTIGKKIGENAVSVSFTQGLTSWRINDHEISDRSAQNHMSRPGHQKRAQITVLEIIMNNM